MKLTPKQQAFMEDLVWTGLLDREDSSAAIAHAMDAAEVAESSRYNNRAAFLLRLVESGAITVRITDAYYESVNESGGKK